MHPYPSIRSFINRISREAGTCENAGSTGILTEAERDQILEGLDGILRDVENGTLKITDKYEDIHSFVEANLIDRIGDAGKKLHTGRSRNDQVALDMKLYTRDEIGEIDRLLKKLLETLLGIMEENIETYMPGFTHLQKAQPITLAHHFGLILKCSNVTDKDLPIFIRE